MVAVEEAAIAGDCAVGTGALIRYSVWVAMECMECVEGVAERERRKRQHKDAERLRACDYNEVVTVVGSVIDRDSRRRGELQLE